MPALPDRYEPTEHEPAVVARWRADGFVHPDASTIGPDEPTFSIAIPPPNVTGVLHMGHALNGTIQDALARLHRLRGERVKWILGTDHAGIATQTKVEQKLAAEGRSREELGREAFEDEVRAWREQYGGTIVSQFERLGATCDFEDERFTLDPGYAHAVRKVFVDLYEQGLIYRDLYLVNWDPGSRSAISELEVEDVEVTDEMVRVAYPVADVAAARAAGLPEEIEVATVRPETMFADVAVAVSPESERWSGLVGKTVVLPLVGREIPVIADARVRADFGTGALKITPAHAAEDFEIGRDHGLPEPSAVTEDGTIADGYAPFSGMTVGDARPAVIEALEAAGVLRGREPYVHTVPHSQRSGERIEPLISLQWFMRMDELAKPAAEVVSSGEVRITPESQHRRYLDWLAEIRPWCVSRQLWWGHRIPVWYRDAADPSAPEEVHCGLEAPEGEGWRQEEDVLDTWFSSALWPFATLGWPEETADLERFYPTSVLSTARDILFLWVARMVMMGLRFPGAVPFRDVYIHSVIQAPDGRRMSKSLGTGVDPLDVVAGARRPPVFAAKPGADPGSFPAYGADALRFGLLAMSSTQDVRFNEEKVAQGRQLVTKLFNAARFLLRRLGEGEATGSGAGAASAPDDVDLARLQRLEDRWIVSRLERASRQIGELLDAYDFAKAALTLYDVVYGELCDWYLEMVKGRDAAADPELRAVLEHVLRRTLQLAHPVIPFVTETLWAALPGAGQEDLLATSRLPDPDDALLDPDAEAAVAAVIGAVAGVRSWRSAANVPPGPVLAARAEGLDPERRALVERLARLDLADGAPADDADAVVVRAGGLDVALLAGEHVDPAAERERAAARGAELEKEIARAEGQLANGNFVARAPAEVVDGVRSRLAELREELAAR